jgi:hypothetical protein
VLFKRILRNLFSVLVIVILTMTSSFAQSSLDLRRLDADTAQKLQSLFDEDAVSCCHRGYLHQEQRQLSDRPRREQSLPRLCFKSFFADFDWAVSAPRTFKRTLKSPRAPPLTGNINT